MTEDEAKTKWCPFVRFAGDEGIVSNRPVVTENDITLCIGSACMAWRIVKFQMGANREPESHGYCGIAGQPTQIP